MNKEKQIKLSSFMTKILRHSPHNYGILLDEKGFCQLDDLLIAITAQDYWENTTVDELKEVVELCENQRFELEGTNIRARYGHSFQKIVYEQKTPPDRLIHGTHVGVVAAILKEGLKPMERQYVHLSESEHFATLAGKRRGELVLLEVDTKKAEAEDVSFFYAGNEVWLAVYVPPNVFEKRK